MRSLGLAMTIALIGLAGPVFAEAKSPDCVALEKQFDQAKKEHVSATKLKHAREQRAHGADLCAKGKNDQGMKALHLALKDIGAEKK